MLQYFSAISHRRDAGVRGILAHTCMRAIKNALSFYVAQKPTQLPDGHKKCRGQNYNVEKNKRLQEGVESSGEK